MTGFDVIDGALLLLGYTTPAGGTDAQQNAEQMRRALPVLNAVLADILRIQRQEPVQMDNLAQELPVEADIAVRVMLPGVAMHLAQGENDGDNYNRFAAEYAQKRSGIPKGERRIADVHPFPAM